MPERAALFRIAKATGNWDVDKLEEDMPAALVVEWNEYLNWELAQYARAIMGALPGAGLLAGSGGGGGAVKITDPAEIAAFLGRIGNG